MSKAMFDPNAVKNSIPRPMVLRDRIEAVLLADDGACYADMEPMLMGNYSGSAQFDKAYAVDVLLKHDAKHENHVRDCMLSNPDAPMNRRQLWNHLQAVLKHIGFVFKGGFMIGTRLEYKAEDADDVIADQAA